MILTFVPGNLLKVTQATEEEMRVVMSCLTAKVDKFKRRNSNWNGDVQFYWYVPTTNPVDNERGIYGYFYLPAASWMRLMQLREPDVHALRPAYEVIFENKENFFNYDITYEQVEEFSKSLHSEVLGYDIQDQIKVLYAILVYRMSSHNIATGFGKTYLSFMLSQFTKFYYEGKTLIIVPRTDLVSQGIKDCLSYQAHLDIEQQLKIYGIAGGIRNYCSLQEAELIFGTFQSLVNMSDDWFQNFSCVVVDEGHTAKALSIKETVCKCVKAEIITAISGTMQYGSLVDRMTIESYCGPMVTNYPASQQIQKGRLPRIAIQPIELQYDTKHKIVYESILQANRLPIPYAGHPTELAATYRRLEIQFISGTEEFYAYILKLCQQYTQRNMNVLIVFMNQQPAINLFEYAKRCGQKAHLIFGNTDRKTRVEIKAQLEREGGWILSSTSGTMSLGISIHNLHACISCLDGKSPHVILQIVGRMFRKHESKQEITMIYDIYNNISSFGSKFDMNNFKDRMKLYKNENHPVYEIQHRII